MGVCIQIVLKDHWTLISGVFGKFQHRLTRGLCFVLTGLRQMYEWQKVMLTSHLVVLLSDI